MSRLELAHLCCPRTAAGTFAQAAVTAGETLMASNETDVPIIACNLAAGAIWWRGGVGIRAEIRDVVQPDRRGDAHYIGFRVGVAFSITK